MKNKIVVVVGQNSPPCVDEEIEALGPGWRVMSANTTIQPFGQVSDGFAMAHHIMNGSPLHVYYATTVVLERE